MSSYLWTPTIWIYSTRWKCRFDTPFFTTLFVLVLYFMMLPSPWSPFSVRPSVHSPIRPHVLWSSLDEEYFTRKKEREKNARHDSRILYVGIECSKTDSQQNIEKSVMEQFLHRYITVCIFPSFEDYRVYIPRAGGRFFFSFPALSFLSRHSPLFESGCRVAPLSL